jgi:hypothetical protein
MGLKGYTAKPIDCKPKTAKREVAIGSYLSDCAGLVVDPNRVGATAFDGDSLSDARKAWADFEGGLNTVRTAPGVSVYLRAERKGFYAVDTGDADTQTRHHGCLMVSEQAPPEGFDPRRPHSRRFIERHMAYLHGDYDLYAIIDLEGAEEAARNPGKVNELSVRRETLLGEGNLVTPRTAEVVERLNALFGVDLVKHGEQSALRHIASDVYIFDPNGGKQVLAESGFAQPEHMVAWFEQFFRYHYKTGYARG